MNIKIFNLSFILLLCFSSVSFGAGGYTLPFQTYPSYPSTNIYYSPHINNSMVQIYQSSPNYVIRYELAPIYTQRLQPAPMYGFPCFRQPRYERTVDWYAIPVNPYYRY